jgi:hypothetical protein
MNWFTSLLAALRIIYRVLVCALCHRKATCRKDALPEGWVKRAEGYVCKACRVVDEAS